MNTPRPVFDNRPGMDAEQLTVHACFHPISTFLNLSGRKEQRWIVRKTARSVRMDSMVCSFRESRL